MKKLHSVILCLFLASAVCAQHKYTNCSAAFLNDKMLVDEYSPTGKCSLDSTATGILKVGTAELWPEREKCHITQVLPFMIGIRDYNTRTIMMYSDKVYKKVDIQEVMKKCRKGDFIVLMTMKDEYALPHNEILVL
jgi:hypothetical protein